MIKAILFVVFFLVFAATIAILVIGICQLAKSNSDIQADKGDLERELKAIRSHYQDKAWNLRSNDTEGRKALEEQMQKEQAELVENWEDVKPKGKPVFFAGLFTSIAVLALIITVPGSFHQVEAGTVAVVKELGKITEVRTPGTYFDFYMTRKYEVYDATVQQVEIRTAAYSHDAQTMDLELYLQYQIQLDKLVIKDENGNIKQSEGIAGKYVTLSSLQARIQTQTIEKTKAVMSAEHFYDPDPETGLYPDNDFAMRGEEIIRNRAAVSNKVSEVVRNAIGDDYYVNVQDVVLTNIDFTDEFERSVEAKVIAEQEKIAAETRANAEAEVAKIKAEAEKTVAEIEAQKKIIEAEANAEVIRIAAQAEAKATVAKIVELARTVGFNVLETESSYTIEFDAVHTEAMFKEIVEDYLEYLAYLEKWNGELPQVVAGDDAISIIVPGSN